VKGYRELHPFPRQMAPDPDRTVSDAGSQESGLMARLVSLVRSKPVESAMPLRLLRSLCLFISPVVALPARVAPARANVFMKQINERPGAEDHRTVLTVEEIQHDTGLRDSLFEVATIQRGHLR
jgi:hypothetical protein